MAISFQKAFQVTKGPLDNDPFLSQVNCSTDDLDPFDLGDTAASSPFSTVSKVKKCQQAIAVTGTLKEEKQADVFAGLNYFSLGNDSELDGESEDDALLVFSLGQKKKSTPVLNESVPDEESDDDAPLVFSVEQKKKSAPVLDESVPDRESDDDAPLVFSVEQKKKSAPILSESESDVETSVQSSPDSDDDFQIKQPKRSGKRKKADKKKSAKKPAQKDSEETDEKTEKVFRKKVNWTVKEENRLKHWRNQFTKGQEKVNKLWSSVKAKLVNEGFPNRKLKEYNNKWRRELRPGLVILKPNEWSMEQLTKLFDHVKKHGAKKWSTFTDKTNIPDHLATYKYKILTQQGVTLSNYKEKAKVAPEKSAASTSKKKKRAKTKKTSFSC